MKKTFFLPIAAAILATTVGIGWPQPAYSQAVVDLVAVNVAAVGKGLRASKVIGSTVVNDQNETIGKIDDMIVDRDKVLFSVINVGGFLGIGGRLVAVPFSSLNVDYNTGKIILPGATKDALKNLPEFKYA
jgi:hypothetical protein